MTTLAPFTAVSYFQFSSVDLDQTLFQPFPSEVVFQSYIPCEVYEVPLVLRNNDRVSAGLCGFKTVLGEESGTVHVECSMPYPEQNVSHSSCHKDVEMFL